MIADYADRRRMSGSPVDEVVLVYYHCKNAWSRCFVRVILPVDTDDVVAAHRSRKPPNR